MSSQSVLLHLLFFLLLFPLLTFSLTEEGVHLLEAKQTLEDRINSLSNWNSHDSNPCNWTGVNCAFTDGTVITVTSVDLTNFSLAGPFASSLCTGLANLSFLSLSYNFINGTLNPSSLLPCSSLTHLDLSQNLLVGSLPSSLASLPKLEYLDLSGNNFSGGIPLEFGSFPKLRKLSLVANLLNSSIPSFFSEISTLTQLNLSYNPFVPGKIPPEFGNFSNLETLWLSSCNLVGSIPAELGKLRALKNLDLSSNSLSGSIPATLAGLVSVQQIELYSNNLVGSLPAGFSNLDELRLFDAAMNELEGPLPADFFEAPALESVHLYENNITGEIPRSISSSRTLSDLRLFSNNLTGGLPEDLGKNSPLLFVDISDNQLSGEIPSSICDKGKLEQLLLLDNQLSGSIPEGLGSCLTLNRVRLANNRLSGEVPASLWGLPHVYLLELIGNSLSGSISPAIAGAGNLSTLLISDNQFHGGIPAELGSLPHLYEFSAANNKLTGVVPASLGNLRVLGKLDLHNNSLSGELPRDVKAWFRLTELNLRNNWITGTIPPELGNLPVLNYLDLSNNELTGEVPTRLQNLKLNQFNLSNNELSGALPPLFSSNSFRDSFLNNPSLCRGIDSSSQGTEDRRRQHSGYLWLLRSIFILSAAVLIFGSVWFFYKYKKYKQEKLDVEKSRWTLTSFHKLGFSDYEVLDCIHEDNAIGSGASGKVYRAVLSNGEAVAIKKLWGNTGNDDGFAAEVVTLGKIRHKNIVKLWCCCTHKDSKLLVYEYMPNGSLGDLLHSSKGRILDWPTRLKIALDAAEGLSYLHHDCVPPILHRDVKSNNILLDAEFGAKVADFGVAKPVDSKEKAMSLIAGSCGYIAPEYAYTLRVNEKSDIYSFGVVILELVTGKRPVDSDIGDKDLVKWVSSTLQLKGIDSVIDQKLGACFKKEISRALEIGLLCTSSLPFNRPSMRKVVKMLTEISPVSNLIKPEKKKGGIKSLYCNEDSSDRGSIV